MKYRQLILIALTCATMIALGQQPGQAIPAAGRDGSVAGQAQSQPPVAAPAASSSVGEFVQRTAVVARLQAEDEVHYEIRRQVRHVFDRVLKR